MRCPAGIARSAKTPLPCTPDARTSVRREGCGVRARDAVEATEQKLWYGESYGCACAYLRERAPAGAREMDCSHMKTKDSATPTAAPKTLVIAEKPSVAQDIVRALTASSGKFEKHDEYFENEQYVVSSAVGHLVAVSYTHLTLPTKRIV